MKKAARSILSVSLALCLLLGTALVLPGPVMVNAALPQPDSSAEGKLYDGIDFEALGGNGIYYGVYDHFNGSSYPGRDTPILWRVMGEENNNGKLTLMSEYLLDQMAFFPNTSYPSSAGNVNGWEQSNINAWLNNGNFAGLSDTNDNSWGAASQNYTSTGFLNSFAPAELVLIEAPQRITTKYNDGTDTGHAITSQKIWIPATNHWANNNYDGDVSWHADLGNPPVDIGPSAASNQASYKGGSESSWWLRSPYSNNPVSALYIYADADGSVYSNNVHYPYGIRPAFQFNPSSVLFASEIMSDVTGKPWATYADGTDYATNPGGANYKLTIVNNGLSTGTVEADGQPVDVSNHPVVTAFTGTSVSVTANGAAGGTQLSYKIVGETGGTRSIVGWGQDTDNTSLTMEAKDLDGVDLAPGRYTVYVWAQKDGGINSHEGSEPVYFELQVEGPPTVSAVSPSGGNVSVGTSSLSITFDKDMNTATPTTGTVSLDKGATVLNGTWMADNRTITYALGNLAHSTAYTVTIEDFEDTYSNVMNPDNSHIFITESDVAPPTDLAIGIMENDTIAEGEDYSKTIPVDYIGSLSLGYSASGLPNGLGVNGSTGVINGQPDAGTAANSPYTVQVTVSENGGSLSDSKSFTITVSSGQAQVYSVTFNLNGGIHTGGGALTQQVEDGKAATAPTTTRDGYTFNGWDKAFSTVTADMTVTAQWTQNTTQTTTTRDRSNSGGSSAVDIVKAAQSSTLMVDAAKAKAALSGMQTGGRSRARISHTGSIKVLAEAWTAFGDTAVDFDTIADGAVQVRVTVPTPGKMTGDMLLSGAVSGSTVEARKAFFEKWFVSKLQVIHLEHTGSFSQPVEVAAKVDLTGMDTTNLYFYSYDKVSNSYRRIENPDYWIDKNGYLHFTTELAGDIIVSEGELKKK